MHDSLAISTADVSVFISRVQGENQARGGDEQQLRRALRRVGLRATNTRIAILREIVSLRTPMSLRGFSRHLAARGFDRVTVWRTLAALSKAETEVGERGGEVIADEDLRITLRKAGFRPSGSRVAILREIMSLGLPMTTAALSRHLTEKGFDPSTILRNVEPFAEASLLTHEDYDKPPTLTGLLSSAFGRPASR